MKSLRVKVLPIGGPEGEIGGRVGGIKTVIIPKENERDLKEVPDNIKEHLTIRAVKWIDEVLAIALWSRCLEPLTMKIIVPVPVTVRLRIVNRTKKPNKYPLTAGVGLLTRIGRLV